MKQQRIKATKRQPLSAFHARLVTALLALCIVWQGTQVVRFHHGAADGTDSEDSFRLPEARSLQQSIGILFSQSGNAALDKNLFVTILVDDWGSCPDKCAFLHLLLPKDVKFQYATFLNHNQDLAPGRHNNITQQPLQPGDRVMVEEKTGWWSGEITNITNGILSIYSDRAKEDHWVQNKPQKICKPEADAPCRAAPYHVSLNGAAEQASRNIPSHTHHHILVVTRKNVEEVAQWAGYYKEQHGHASIGLFLMADEKLPRHRVLQKIGLYPKFDYVLRNYWFPPEEFGMPLQALGNGTCGTQNTGDIPSNYPAHGMHWVMLQPHEHNVLLQNTQATSTWPTSLRPHNCTFKGWKGLGDGGKSRKYLGKAVARKEYASLNCDVQLIKGFNGGEKINGKESSKFEYLTSLTNSKIGFNPRGVHPECHRLPELLSSGTVPGMTHEAYMDYVPMRSIPGIVGAHWREVMDQVEWYLSTEKGMKWLERMSKDGIQWWNDVQECQRADMGEILTKVVEDHKERGVEVNRK